MNHFPNNSNSAKNSSPEGASNSEEPAPKVIRGKIIRRKKSLGDKIKDTFIGGESQKGVLSYLAHEVLIPALKDIVFDVIHQGVERTLYSDGGRLSSRRSGYRPNGSNRINYSRYSSDRDREWRREVSPRTRERHSFDDIILESREEAMDVLDEMSTKLEKYKSVSVADLYSILGVTSSYTDEKWGWFSLREANIVPARGGGFLLVLPSTEHLD